MVNLVFLTRKFTSCSELGVSQPLRTDLIEQFGKTDPVVAESRRQLSPCCSSQIYDVASLFLSLSHTTDEPRVVAVKSKMHKTPQLLEDSAHFV